MVFFTFISKNEGVSWGVLFEIYMNCKNTINNEYDKTEDKEAPNLFINKSKEQ